MIKLFLHQLEKATIDTYVSILKYIDDKLDDHNSRIREIEKYKRLNDLEIRVTDLEKRYDKTRMEVENSAENRKFWKKAFLTAAISAVVAYMARMIGLL